MADYYFQCVNCNQKLDAGEFHYLCPECSKDNKAGEALKGILWMKYDYEKARKTSASKLLKHLWPIENFDSLPPLKIGNTPLYCFDSLDQKELSCKLFIKDDSQNPSYSFKDRASALVSAFAKEKKVSTIVTASTGNAGSSLAAICASQNQKAIVLLPESAPLAKLVQVEMYGAELQKVNGNYDLAFEKSIELSRENGWFNRNTAYNPLTVEGKKSISFELYDQLNGQLPDMVFVPVGDGVILSGLYKGFEDLLLSNYLSKMPQIVAVQAEGSSNLIDNLNTDPPLFPSSNTIADSIAVDIPRNFYMAKYYLKKYNGLGIIVKDKEIMQASSKMAKNFGLFPEPASGAAFAGFIKYYAEGRIQKDSRVLILHTGSGLKDISSAQKYLSDKL